MPESPLSGSEDLRGSSLEDFRGPRSWRRKFDDAFRGLKLGARGQSSFAVHFFCAIAVVMAGKAVRLERDEWAVIALCIGGVFTAELFNTAVESLAKAVTEEHDPYIRNALDISAGAVLAASLTAAVTGWLIFWPKLWLLFNP